MTMTSDATPIERARALAVAVAERHAIGDLTAYLNGDTDEAPDDTDRAVFDSMSRAGEELAVEFDCDAELLRRDLPKVVEDDDEIEGRDAAHSILRGAVHLAGLANTPDEVRARDLLRRAFTEAYIPSEPSGWAPRHAQRAIELLDDAEAFDWARADTEGVFARWSTEGWGVEFVVPEVDEVRAVLVSYEGRAKSIF